MFRSLKGEAEGFVDRYFNRTFSRLLTRLFLQLKCSPNTITMVATAVGLLAAVGFGLGSYTARALWPRCCFNFSRPLSIVAMARVARLTFTESLFGAWLDIAMDNVVHIAIFAGIACGAYMRQGRYGRGGSPFGAAAQPCSANASGILAGHQGNKRSAPLRGWEYNVSRRPGPTSF